MSGPDHLRDFLIDMARRPWRDGDCGVMLALWFLQRGGYLHADEMASFRNTAVDKWAGMYRVICRICRRHDVPVTDYPVRGDIGVIRAGNAVLAAICTGAGWASKTASGMLVVKQATVLRAWSLA